MLAIVGVMAGVGIQAIQTTTNTENCYPKTRAQMREIEQSLANYVRNNNRYPTPANRTLASSSSSYGVATTAGIDTIGSGTSAVQAGGLPFVTLGLGSNYAADCWGNKFTYYVSSQLTDTSTYMSNSSAGRITVKSGTLSSSQNITSSAAYAVVSHGQDALGSAPRNGAGSYCTGSYGDRIDQKNCKNSGTLELFSANFNNGKTNGTLAANYFDDVVLYANKTGYTGCNAGGGQTLTWTNAGGTVTCSANISGSHANGAGTGSLNSGSPNGSATFKCVNGTYTVQPGSTCYANCPASQSVSWGGGSCSATYSGGAGAHGAAASVGSSDPNNMGTGNLVCNNGTWEATGSGTSCATRHCSAQAVNWSPGCSASVGALSNGQSSNNLANTAANYSGSVNVTCSNGALSQSSASCTQVCTAGTVSWGAGCSASVGQLTNGGSTPVTNGATNYSGNATVTCNNGSRVVSGATCTATAPCSASTVSWGSNCSGSVSSASHGETRPASNGNSGYTGTATATCSNGSWSTSGATCNVAYNNCNSQTVTWGSGCSATAPFINHGSTSNVNNAAGGRVGSATVSCSNGTATASGNCYADCTAQTVSWNGTCSAAVGTVAHGGSTNISNTASGYTGSASVACNNGSLSTSGTSCNPVYVGCGAATLSWGSCSGSIGALGHGANGGITNSVEGYSGSATATCSNGSWSLSGTSCNAVACNPTTVSGQTSPRAWSGNTPYPEINVNICNYTSIPAGGKFSITSDITGSSWIGYTPLRIWNLTQGVPYSGEYDTGTEKYTKVTMQYNGACNVYLKAQYHGKSSDYKYGQVSLTQVDKCKVNGGWTDWYYYCSNTCGVGRNMRYRTCSNPYAKNGGTECSGPYEEDAGSDCEDYSFCDQGGGGQDNS